MTGTKVNLKGKIMKISSLLILLLSLMIISCNKKEEKHTKPNILWIVSEDNSPMLGAYGDSLAVTPNLDRLARQGVVYENAFATTPVCAPSRFTLITGMYANGMGTENMRSTNSIPGFVQFFPKYLREAGYYTTNNHKKDYNTIDQPGAWDESSSTASYKNRAHGQPFFHVQNIYSTHESRIHGTIDTLIHDPNRVTVPPYLPSTPRVKRDIAHYYDQITKMDARVGEILDELQQSGEAENTIVFYYSDHGGVMPRSKRFMFESGLHIPLMVYFPPRYVSWAPKQKRTDRLVTFADFAPTVLSLAGIDPPDYLQGRAFLGKFRKSPQPYIHMYRGRMDERYDLIRTVRSKHYLYIHNYMPQRRYGQHIAYLWKAPSMQSWQEEYRKGNLNSTQQRFWEAKAPEELYDIDSDPYNIRNLADNPAYKEVLLRMRKSNHAWMKKLPDLGVIPESRIKDIVDDKSLYEAVREQDIPMDKIIETAEMASQARKINLDTLAIRLDDPIPAVRYWAAMGMLIAGRRAETYDKQLLQHAEDTSPEVRMAVAGALYKTAHRNKALVILENTLDDPDIFMKLEALNVLESLNPDKVPVELEDKVRELNQQFDVDSEPKSYISRAASSLLEKIKAED